MTHILIDVGGSKIRVGVSRDLSALDAHETLETPKTYAEALDVIVGTAQKLSGGAVDDIAAGIPALLSSDRRSVVGAATNIGDWLGKNVAADLEGVFHAKTYLENDVALVGLGEAVFGAGKGSAIMMYLTVSTGVNGARVVNGVLDPMHFGAAIGHQYVAMQAGAQKWEALISGKAIHEKYGVHPRELGKDSPVWEALAPLVAFGLHNAILHWSPDRIVLGGSMFNEIGISVERVGYHLEKINNAVPELPQLVHSALGDLGGLWGGIARLRQTTAR